MASDLEFLQDLAEKLGITVVRAPRFRYWRVRGDHYAFAYTTERTSDGKFWALKYRITKNAWKLVKKVAFGRRRVAKARAYKWYQNRKAALTEALAK
jgi:hypothetical protein